MIIDDSKRFRILMEAEYPDLRIQEMSDEELIEVQLKDGDRVRRLRTYSQSQATKKAWREKRFNFMQGIRKYNRDGDIASVKDRVKKRLDRFRKRIAFAGNDDSPNQYESVIIDLPEYEIFDFLNDLILLEGVVARIAGTFALAESYIESAIFAREVFVSLGVIKEALTHEEGPQPIPCEAFETFLILVADQIFEDLDENDGPLCGLFSKLVMNEVAPSG